MALTEHWKRAHFSDADCYCIVRRWAMKYFLFKTKKTRVIWCVKKTTLDFEWTRENNRANQLEANEIQNALVNYYFFFAKKKTLENVERPMTNNRIAGWLVVLIVFFFLIIIFIAFDTFLTQQQQQKRDDWPYWNVVATAATRPDNDCKNEIKWK